jgi:hypothetical protein
MFFYPLVVLMHVSNPTASLKHEVTHDYLGAGVGVELKNGLTIEATAGRQSLGCLAEDCGRNPAATLSLVWRGRRR